MVIQAPAKINLTLEVLARRENGYHTLRSLLVPLAFADELHIGPADALRFTCTEPALGGDDNLVVRALAALGEIAPRHVHLIKHIPTQAGLGGGSSDAAAVFIAAMSGAFGRVPEADWLALARALGSDVPFFLAQTGALVEGTGDRVTPVGELPSWHVLIIKPPIATSTMQAYRELDARSRPTRTRNESVTLRALNALQRGDFEGLETCLWNDFHEIAAGPDGSGANEIARTFEALRSAGATNALLCGSGSAVFTLAQDRAAIDAITAHIELPDSYLRILTQFATTPEWCGARR